MARRRKNNDYMFFGSLIIVIICCMLISLAIYIGYYVLFVLIAIIILLIPVAIAVGIFLIFNYFYSESYFKSDEFKVILNRVQKNINDCNLLNIHIEELKKSYLNYQKTDYGNSRYTDESNYNYNRRYLNIPSRRNVCDCSLQVCRSASRQPYKYICKYFNIAEDKNTLEEFEKILNNFVAVEQGKYLLKKEQDEIIDNVMNEVPYLIRHFNDKKLIKKLNMLKVNLSDIYYPTFEFRYISGGGNSQLRSTTTLNIAELEGFIKYLASVIEFKDSIKGQRYLMTCALREKIKKRDQYTCKICGISLDDEPNLLLEIDHIVPLSKGGKSIEKNLQTLCWRCNRTKGSKIIDKS